MVRLKIRKVGNSLGVTLPAEAARALKVREGDQVFLTEGVETAMTRFNGPGGGRVPGPPET